jgi:hypothetical protein
MTEGTTVIITLTVGALDRREAIAEAFAILEERDSPHPVNVSVWADDGSKWGTFATVSRHEV